MHAMSPVTLDALARFPSLLAAHYAAIPDGYARWAPPSWDGVPSEALTALEQVCHVRDIEVLGYHVRLRRTRDETTPRLASLDTDALVIDHDYAHQDAGQVLAAFRIERARTVDFIAGLPPAQLDRTAEFEGYGTVTLRGLVHYLCSHDQQHLAGLQWLMGKIDADRSAARRG